MPSREWKLRIQDILESIDEILQWTADYEFDSFMENRLIVKAGLYNFGIIGEATRNIPAEIQLRYPQIPWRSIGDTRNVIFHEYFQVELAIIWRTIQHNLPILKLQLQDILENESEN
jgi:uncharacterized protein with HEPN domain